jgi:hypothetical protein
MNSLEKTVEYMNEKKKAYKMGHVPKDDLGFRKMIMNFY